jgi:ABC-type branched-subunit amino acid transport system ATPase component
VVVEHRLELLSAISDRVMVMDQGKVIVEGSAAEAFADPAVQRAYFAVPPTTT